jgi:hypothetical protein
MSEMPPFAQAWMNQWHAAAPELERVRREELRKLDPALGISLPTSSTQAVAGSLSGLVEQQAWFMRAMLLAAYAKAR